MGSRNDPDDDKDKPWVQAHPEPKEQEENAVDTWKVPIWQRPIDPATLALHPDGPLDTQRRDGYLQKRAGNSRLRWNIRYFELSNGHLKWWRPQFSEMLKMPLKPKIVLKEPRPRPIRCLDLSKLKSVMRTRVKFPYSTRIKLFFHEDYTKYTLELRAERENIILEWFRVFARFTLETYETEVEKAEDDKEDTTATPGSQSDEEEGFEDVSMTAAGADAASFPEERRGPVAKAKIQPSGEASAGSTDAACSGGYSAGPGQAVPYAGESNV